MSTATRPPRRDDLVVIGEAVELELRPATVMHRLLSGLLDLAVYGAVAAALLIGLTRLITNDAHLTIVSVVVLATAMVVLPTTVETLSRGLSVGRLAVGVRVVRDDGGPVRFRHALVRSVIGILEIWTTFGGLAVITSILSKRGKRIGDILAGTYAVRVRDGQAALAPLLMPPELARWAELADIRRLPDQLGLHARAFLGRTSVLAAPARASLGRQLAAAVEPYVAPPPPWGTHPERFLAAVLVARRDREYRAGLVEAERDGTAAARSRRLPFGIPDSV